MYFVTVHHSLLSEFISHVFHGAKVEWKKIIYLKYVKYIKYK